ncbi:DNA mismatch repair protein MutH [Sporosarcina sp. NCCP-2716]|uniref:Sau3AI family type II restriction endonuclease n=1 Tax=Sporosarcina sp. NCCP-2716 TaxID=2943679 RepID=UPI002040DB7B|nr:Sau3AI family type II restriction endonuclease [Sporosarcina sp. NCCP-2716]GKV69765.1 DNA mismatch repair protein MutH [Sporosarcina sp. NCCP-2716]
MIYKSRSDLMLKAAEAEGMTFGDIDKSGRILNERAKGHLGQIVEESFFEYKVNSKSEADFAELGIELKVTPVRTNKNGTLSSKERLVLNIINYMDEVDKEFETSSFWRKNKELLIMFYEWLPKVKRADYKIIKSYLHEFEESDLKIIKKDWEVIVGKIKEGLAHQLSEADTNYLAACTKGANKASKREQPCSEELAMQRAYSLKQSYMTALARKIISKQTLQTITNGKELENFTFEEILVSKFEKYEGKSLEEISRMAGIVPRIGSKNFLQVFISGLLGIKGTKLDDIDEFAKANIQFKTVRLEPNGIPKENMSFKNINFTEWMNEEWEDSWLENYFSSTKLLFVVFEYKETEKENPERELFFKGIKLWNMPLTTIEGKLKPFFYELQNLIKEGIELRPTVQKKRTIVNNNLPKAKANGICHIRPKARDGSDKVALPDGRMISKQSFWLDKEYISVIIQENN